MKTLRWLDDVLYRDTELPDTPGSVEDRVGFWADLETVAEVRKPEWREAVDRCRLLTSPTYYLPTAPLARSSALPISGAETGPYPWGPWPGPCAKGGDERGQM